MHASIQGINEYIQTSKESPITAALIATATQGKIKTRTEKTTKSKKIKNKKK